MRLIDAEALEGRILMDAPGFMDGGSEITKAFILAMIKTRSVTPTVDAIPVVRCKDCKHRGDRNKCIVAFVAEKQEMPYFFYDNRGEWFCADGVRRDE